MIYKKSIDIVSQDFKALKIVDKDSIWLILPMIDDKTTLFLCSVVKIKKEENPYF